VEGFGRWGECFLLVFVGWCFLLGGGVLWVGGDVLGLGGGGGVVGFCGVWLGGVGVVGWWLVFCDLVVGVGVFWGGVCVV